MSSTFEKIAWVIAILAFLPTLIVWGGFAVAAGIAIVTLGTYYGGSYGLRLYEQQNVGKKSGRFDVNSTLNGRDDSRDWGRE